ncbi:class I SAM-dependent methyltransferase [Streptomyces caatingaensis]|uniref:Polyketide synthesis methyltransferase n=1 Tax=Streptomyces caatingaensis TaxID=1678637 RepID=A0A0K9XJC0_9ACTN|nr:class I SAM-dependent methyltransferase [Streptomyces caatingaensis]KNB53413.1 polyketide synthesis methyltransferase [Streptomyces caatingaensis]
MVETIQLTGAQETLLATLQARALDNRRPRPVLGDSTAEALLRRIEYDFGRIRTGAKDERIVTFRAKKLDEWASAYLAGHPDAVVLHLGCGLDSRAFRLDVPPGVLWIDVDMPEVVELRGKLYPDKDGYRMIGSSVTDEGWLADLPTGRDVLVLAEGLTPYLPEAGGEAMLRRITRHFPAGMMAFDAVVPLAVRCARFSQLLRATGATFGWGVGDPRSLEMRVPGLRHREQWSLIAAPQVADAGPVDRAIGAAMRRIPPVRDSYRLLRYTF